ncbi:MAG: hypothetical protein KDK36_06860 [Leptospiraceae bacterium]|nr:hypothetical protein [Leptospiraceae bacterium]
MDLWKKNWKELEKNYNNLNLKNNKEIFHYKKSISNLMIDINNYLGAIKLEFDNLEVFYLIENLKEDLLNLEMNSTEKEIYSTARKMQSICEKLEELIIQKEELDEFRSNKRNKLMNEFIIETEKTIKFGKNFEGAWVQGKKCTGETLIHGWPGDDAWSTIHVEAIENTLRLIITQREKFQGIEIDDPIRWNPNTTSCFRFTELRLYLLPEKYIIRPKDDWSNFSFKIFKPKINEKEMFYTHFQL